jgi:putative sigma-54 modulation protein
MVKAKIQTSRVDLGRGALRPGRIAFDANLSAARGTPAGQTAGRKRSVAMQVTVTGRHYEVTPALRTYVDARLERLLRYSDNITTVHVILSAEKHRHGAEIVLHGAGKDLTSKEVADDMYSAIDAVSEKLEKQLRRLKRKRTATRKGGSIREAATTNGTRFGTLRILRAGSVGRGAEEHDIVETGEYPLEHLTVDEAILRLEDRKDHFLVFANRSTEFIHIVYKMSDGNYGVLNLPATT